MTLEEETKVGFPDITICRPSEENIPAVGGPIHDLFLSVAASAYLLSIGYFIFPASFS